MSRLVEQRKRTERVAAEGHTFTGSKAIWAPNVPDDGYWHCAGEVFTLGIGDYRLEMSEAEVLNTMSQWCAEVARRRCAEDQRKEKSP